MIPQGAALPAPGFVLNVHKEVPWTSHDAVSLVRRILGVKAVGHAGSLDPFATGVLVIAVGRATKLVPYLMDLPKGYRGTLCFGRRTSTADAGGEVVEEGSVPQVDLEAIRAVARSFQGEIEQIPPMVSAIKHQGRRLYELARKGVEVERKARRIRVERFEITRLELPRADFELECSRGTYVRTLVEDLAERLGALAFVESLIRTKVGHFVDADSCRLLSPPGSHREGLLAKGISMSVALQHLPVARVDGHWAHRLRQGAAPPMRWLDFEVEPRPGQVVRLIGPDGDLMAIGTLDFIPGPADRPVAQSLLVRLERVI